MTNSLYTPDEPIAAIATALVPSAIGIIRTSGKDAINLVSNLFSRKKALLEAEANTTVYGWIVNPKEEDKEKSKIDEVMLAVYKAPKSYTGEEMVEIFCHGGTQTVLGIYNLLLANGFRQAQRGEYTFRAYINKKMDLTKAEAVNEIITSKTDDSRTKAAGRLAGNLFEQITSLKNKLMHVIAGIEVEIEYPEDEENIAETFDLTELEEVRFQMNELSKSWNAEKLYQDGAKVVLCGRTNAGKSSLFNVLLKEERAIVSDIHGTTRDFIESWASFDGMPVRLYDTAGLRETTDIIEKKGVERTISLFEDADLIVYVVDSIEGLSEEDISFIKDRDNKNIPLVFVWNKCENSDCKIQDEKLSGLGVDAIVSISAKKGQNIALLTKTVKEQIILKVEDSQSHAGLGSERQRKCIQDALESIEHALVAQDEGFTMDAVVQDIEDALSSLSEITGEITPGDILETVFSDFCVGK